MKRILPGFLAVIAVASIIGNLLMYQRYSSNKPLVKVGSEVIRVKDYRDAQDYESGKSVLNKMVYESLVMQAAAKAGLTPTDKDIDDRLAQIQRRQPQMLALANSDPQKMADLRHGLRTTIALENLRVKAVKVQPGELEAFYSKNQAAFVLPVQSQTTLIVAPAGQDGYQPGMAAGSTAARAIASRARGDAATAASLLGQKVRGRNGKMEDIKPDVIARQPRMHVAGVDNFKIDMTQLSPQTKQQIAKAIFGMKPPQIKTIPVVDHGFTYYFTFKVNRSEGQHIPNLAEIRPQVERVYKLMRAPVTAQQELANLYDEAKPQFEIDRYAGYFNDIQQVIDAQKLAKPGTPKTASAR